MSKWNPSAADLRRSLPLDTHERGMGTIGTVVGVGAFLAFLLLAAHLSVGLYAQNVVAASTWAAARSIAHQPHDPGVHHASINALRNDLQGFHDVGIDASVSEQHVRISVTARRDSLLPTLLRDLPLLSEIHHTTTVRTEDLR